MCFCVSVSWYSSKGDGAGYGPDSDKNRMARYVHIHIIHCRFNELFDYVTAAICFFWGESMDILFGFVCK